MRRGRPVAHHEGRRTIEEEIQAWVATPKNDIDLIKRRLKDAVLDHAARFKEEPKP